MSIETAPAAGFMESRVGKDHNMEHLNIQACREAATREVTLAAHFLARVQQDLDYAGDELDSVAAHGWLTEANDLLERARVMLFSHYCTQAWGYARAAVELGAAAEIWLSTVPGIDPLALEQLQASGSGNQSGQQIEPPVSVDQQTVGRELARQRAGIERCRELVNRGSEAAVYVAHAQGAYKIAADHHHQGNYQAAHETLAIVAGVLRAIDALLPVSGQTEFSRSNSAVL